jgi:hypothetical protein
VKEIVKTTLRTDPNIDEKICPFKENDVCNASMSSLFLNKKRKEEYCDNESYDGCPIFLAKMLRQEE